MNTAVIVTIAGQEVRLSCKADEAERMVALAGDVERQLEQLGVRHPGLSPRALTLIAALTLTGKLRVAQAQNRELRERCAALEREREARALAAEEDDPVVLEAVTKAAETMERVTALLTNDLRAARTRSSGEAPDLPALGDAPKDARSPVD